MPNHIFPTNTYKKLLSCFFMLTMAATLNALPPDHYASSSVLAEGNWVRIGVEETGMQFISDATLKSLGFSNPETVNVYGYGGKVIPENLNSPDDLPQVVSLRVSDGIMFFGESAIAWDRNSGSKSEYTHQSHPYSDKSYYFLNDSRDERFTPTDYPALQKRGEAITQFTERLVHEQDLIMPINTGRFMLGEDFKSQPSRTFHFNLKGNQGDATVTTNFAALNNSGVSTLVFTANGQQLDASTTDRLSYSSTKIIITTTTVKNVENPGESLEYNIKFNGSGTITFAALNYIEVEYPRSLEMGNGELYFYLSPVQPNTVRVKGAASGTEIWNVTDKGEISRMAVEFDGEDLVFVSPAGYHEFIAFDPTKAGRNITIGEKITNQDIHSLESPDMLVISPAEYKSAALRLADLHRDTDGLRVTVLTPEEIYNEFSSGKPDVSAFRKLLKMWYDRAEGREGEYAGYCLIMSRPTYDNKMVTAKVRNSGYPRVPIWQSATGETATTSYSTDDYIGMLKDVTGTFNIGTAEIQVAVGRMPVKNINEANQAIDKLEKYILNPDLGAWRKNVMVIADDQDGGVHLTQAETAIRAMKSAPKGNDYLYEKLYQDAFQLEYTSTGAEYPQAHERMMNKWNEGTAFINYIGHANPKAWGHENMLTWKDINSMSNTRLPYIYAATCEFLRWDDDDISGGEILWLLPNSGVIGMMCPSREVLITSNGTLNESTSRYIFAENRDGELLSVGEIMIKGKNASNTGTNKLRYGLIGDPSMKLPWTRNNVVVDRINGIDITEAEDFPVLKARSSVTLSGHISDSEGNVSEDFNGIAEIALYDAEKVITTHGNGSDGVESIYNDRPTRLYFGRAKVTNGLWESNFTMPSEIENNYSPALLSLYAYDAKGTEANGSCEKLYAFGFDETAPEDFEGPKIIEFYLNKPSFVSGSQVAPNPVMTVSFYDESGISVSEAGIGHNIYLSLDGKDFYDDVAQYYMPDENEGRAGSITYPLGEVSQGNHTLTFTVWDNANNSTTASLDFVISPLWKPSIETLTTDVNPATTSVNFIIGTDGATSSMECHVEVYDIWGRKVWQNSAPSMSGTNTRTSLGWDLNDFGGAKVPGGIYLYKATVKTESGATVTKTKKLMVR